LKNTIDELSAVFTGGKDIGLLSSNIPEKMRENCLRNEKLFFENMMFHNTGKRGGKGICDWKHALEHMRSHEHSVEHIDATITFSRRCHYEELIQS